MLRKAVISVMGKIDYASSPSELKGGDFYNNNFSARNSYQSAQETDSCTLASGSDISQTQHYFSQALDTRKSNHF